MADQVKCSECGYLAARNCKTRELVEAEGRFRHQGDIPSDGVKNFYEEWPVCFMNIANFREEIGDSPGSKKRQDAISTHRGRCISSDKRSLNLLLHRLRLEVQLVGSSQFREHSLVPFQSSQVRRSSVHRVSCNPITESLSDREHDVPEENKS